MVEAVISRRRYCSVIFSRRRSRWVVASLDRLWKSLATILSLVESASCATLVAKVYRGGRAPMYTLNCRCHPSRSLLVLTRTPNCDQADVGKRVDSTHCRFRYAMKSCIGWFSSYLRLLPSSISNTGWMWVNESPPFDNSNGWNTGTAGGLFSKSNPSEWLCWSG